MFSKKNLTNNLATKILSLTGIIITSYLTFVHYTNVAPICGPVSDCHKVQTSEYATILGIPLSLLGILLYTLIFIVSLTKRKEKEIVLFVLSLTGFTMSIYLTFIEFFLIKAFCLWCLTSALIMTCLFLIWLKKLLLPVKAS